jgi:hypothetical protein
MKLLADSAFDAPKYDPKLLNALASTRWFQWGRMPNGSVDYAIHDTVGRFQNAILNRLLSNGTLSRIQDCELRVAPGADAYTMAEHIRLTVDGVFGELSAPAAGEYTNRKAFIPSFRRNLQQTALKKLAGMVAPSGGGGIIIIDLSGGGSFGSGPEDARVLARMHLKTLDDRIKGALAKEDLKLDDYSKAHLLDMQERIKLALNAQATTSVN